MTSTINTRNVELGQKAYIKGSKAEEVNSTKIQARSMSPVIKVVKKVQVPSSESKVAYIWVNIEKKKRKDVYRKINRRLGEG